MEGKSKFSLGSERGIIVPAFKKEKIDS